MSNDTSPPQWPALMTIATIALYTDMSRRTIEKLRATGELGEPVKVPHTTGKLWFARQDVDAAIARWRRGEAPAAHATSRS